MFVPGRINRRQNKMSTKFAFLTTLLCCSLAQLASATDDTSVRATGIQKLTAQRKNVDDYVFKLSFERENDILNSQTYTRIDHAGVLKQRAHFEMEQLRVSYRFIAELMNASKNVLHCMDETTKQAQEDLHTHNYEKCYKPIHESHEKAGAVEQDKMFDWEEKKTPMYREYTTAYDETTLRIKKTDNPAEIQSSVNGVVEKGENLIQASKEIISEIRKIEMDQLVFADEGVNRVRQYARKSVDNLIGALQNCFLVRSPFFNLRKIFIKDNLL